MLFPFTLDRCCPVVRRGPHRLGVLPARPADDRQLPAVPSTQGLEVRRALHEFYKRGKSAARVHGCFPPFPARGGGRKEGTAAFWGADHTSGVGTAGSRPAGRRLRTGPVGRCKHSGTTHRAVLARDQRCWPCWARHSWLQGSRSRAAWGLCKGSGGKGPAWELGNPVSIPSSPAGVACAQLKVLERRGRVLWAALDTAHARDAPSLDSGLQRRRHRHEGNDVAGSRAPNEHGAAGEWFCS